MLDELITGPYLQCALCGEGGHRISLQEGKEKSIPGLHSYRSTNYIKAFFKRNEWDGSTRKGTWHQEPEDGSSILGPTGWKKKTNSCKLSSDPRSYTQINKLVKKLTCLFQIWTDFSGRH